MAKIAKENETVEEIVEEVVEDLVDDEELTGEMLEEFTNGRGDIDE